jgi:energy-coupling factor transporter ATP-binding protein EcfA2
MAYSLQTINFSYCYPGTDTAVLHSLSFSLQEGECICITGPSGAGKSTLLLAIQGLLKGGRCSGKIRIDMNGCSKPSGLMFQNADSQIVCTTVEEEVAFGPENLGFPPEETEENVRNALRAVGLDGFEKRNVERLSAGEKQRVTIASVLSMNPTLLLFDEPTGQLDEAGTADLVRMVRELKQRGHSIIIAEHNVAPFAGIADRFLHLENGEVEEVSFESLNERSFRKSPSKDIAGADDGTPIAGPVLEIEGVSWCGTDGSLIFHDVNLRLSRGEYVHLYGANGVGKSTVLKIIAGLQPPAEGSLRTAGILNPRPESLLGKVALLFQNPQKQFFEDTVRAEAAFALNMLKYAHDAVAHRVEEALTLCRVNHLADRSPFSLSFGEQHRVALASVIAPNPELLLLDEPFTGLDFGQRYRLLDILSRLRQSGTAIILASHGPLPEGEAAQRRLVLQDGTIHEG